MSLEARIELLTAAVIELTAAIGAMQAPGPIVQVASTDLQRAVNVHEAIINEKTEVAGEKEPEPSSDTTSGEQSRQTGESSSPELTYNDHVKPATLKLSQKRGREVAIAVLGHFGVKGAQNLDASQWADYIAHCESVMNGGEV